MKPIYLDNQATTPLDDQVLQAMLSVGMGNPHSNGHAVGWAASAQVENARQQVAEFIGADPDEIFFTSGATEANNLAILGVRKEAQKGRNRVLRSSIEHKSVVSTCDALSEEYGFAIDAVPVDGQGAVAPSDIAAMTNDATALVSVALVNNEIGTIQDLQRIRAAAGSVLLHCDAAQAPEAIDMSDTANFCDMMSLSAHKMRGPMGVGVLYVSRHAQSSISPILFGGGQQSGIRPGTLPVHLCVGMGAACALAAHNVQDRLRMTVLRDLLLTRLRTLHVKFDINGPDDPKRRHPGNANILLNGADADQLIAILQPRLAISTGSACTSGFIEPSHVLTAIGLSAEDANSSIRLSIGAANTEDDVVAAAELIAEARAKLA